MVAPPGLGTINHTLLTLQAVRSAGLEISAVVLTPWPDQPSEMEQSNRETIEHLGFVPVQTLPRSTSPSRLVAGAPHRVDSPRATSSLRAA